jgi:RNA polymerase sigma-70 factor (ECF subfamily)
MDVLQKPSRISRFCFRPGKLRGKVRCRKPAKPDSSFSMPPDPGRNTASPAAHGEWALVQRAIDGNSAAHDQLFVRHTSTLRRIAFRILRNREDAEDAVQDGLCKAYTRLGSFEGRSSFRTWLTRIVINSALMIRRRKNAHPEASLDEIFPDVAERPRYEIIAAGPSPEEFCAAGEIHALVEKQLRQLSPALQTALQLYALDGRSTAESMRALGIHKGAFKSRVSRARQKVANGLRQSFQLPATRLSVVREI